MGVKTPMEQFKQEGCSLPGPASIKAFVSNCFKAQVTVAVPSVHEAVRWAEHTQTLLGPSEAVGGQSWLQHQTMELPIIT